MGGTHAATAIGPAGFDKHKRTSQPQSSALAGEDAKSRAADAPTAEKMRLNFTDFPFVKIREILPHHVFFIY